MKDPKLRKAAQRLQSNVELFGSQQREEIRQYVASPKEMAAGLHKYSELVSAWPRIVQTARAMARR